MARLLLAALAVVFAAGAASASESEVRVWSFLLGAAPGAPARGRALLRYDAADASLSYGLAWSDLQGDLTAVDLHGPASPDESTPEVLAALFGASGVVIAGYGDSLTGYYSTKWCGRVVEPHRCEPSHAVPGERTRPGVTRLLADLASGAVIDPATTHVTLAWGANDVRAIFENDDATWLSDIETPLRNAVDAVRAHGFVPVLVVTLPQYDLVPSEGTEECVPAARVQLRIDTQLAPRILDIADDYDPPIPVVDLNAAYGALPDATKCPGAFGEGYYLDLVHQTPAGYAFMRDVFLHEIAPCGASCGPRRGTLTGSLGDIADDDPDCDAGDLLACLVEERAYLLLHSEAFPDGELRGNVRATPEASSNWLGFSVFTALAFLRSMGLRQRAS